MQVRLSFYDIRCDAHLLVTGQMGKPGVVLLFYSWQDVNIPIMPWSWTMVNAFKVFLILVIGLGLVWTLIIA